MVERVWTTRFVRFLWGLGIGGVVKLLGVWAASHPVFSLLGATSLGFVVTATLFGWPGLVGMAVVHMAFVSLRGTTPEYLALGTAAYSAAGALVLLTFRRVPGIGRAMPNIRSLQWYILASGVGGVFTSTLIAAGWGDSFFPDLAVWLRATVVSVWVFGPFLLISGWWLLRPWLATVPDETEPADRRRFSLRRAEREIGAEAPSEIVARPEPDLGRSLLGGLALIGGIAFLTVAAADRLPAASYWASLLYLLPIYWAAHRHRLGGALVASAVVGSTLLSVQGLLAGAEAREDEAVAAIEVYAQLLGFFLIGPLLGGARERETELLERLAESVRRLRGDLQRVVRALTGAVEAKDSYTEGHLQRVSAYALEVGRRLGLGPTDLELLQIASALHDIGKIGIPEQILNKPGPLDPSERAIIERHPDIGARILESLDGLEDAAPLVRHHQERYDGRRNGEFPGYPRGLAGDEIPLGARIIAVVDAFDAMTTDRAYRAARPMAEAVAVLREERGRQFDPRVVDLFVELLGERPWS